MLRTLRPVLACALLGLSAGAAHAQPPVWVVHGPHATLVLFGSVHLLPPGLDWEPQPVKQAAQSARDVWFEVPMDDAAALSAAQLAIQRGLLPPGDTLDSKLSEAGRARLAKVATEDGLSLDRIQRLRPWLAEITLSLASYRKAGALQDQGVEHQLLSHLPAEAERKAFETPREQIEALSQASAADQAASLEETLSELEIGDVSYQTLLKAWMAGDVAGLKAVALDPLVKTAPGVYRAMVVERNHRWLAAIRKRLQGSGEALMVVGVGHLIGPDSVPALLRAEGVQVDGP